MKKATKLLTAVATAAALILGACAFVSCSNSSDSSSAQAPAGIDPDNLPEDVEAVLELKIEEDGSIKDVELSAEEKEAMKLFKALVDDANEKKTAYDTGKTTLKEKQVDVENKQTALTDAQKELAEKEDNDKTEELEDKVTEAQTALTKAQGALTKAEEELADAQAEYVEALGEMMDEYNKHPDLANKIKGGLSTSSQGNGTDSQ